MKHFKNISKGRVIIYCAAVFLVFTAILLPDKYCGSEVQNTDMQDVTDNKDSLDLKECFLDIRAGFGGKPVIPDPAKTDGKVSVSLLSWDNVEKAKWYKKNGDLYLGTDLSFAGFKRPVFVGSYAVGDMTEKSGMVSFISEKTANGIAKKKVKGSCLVLFVLTKMEDYETCAGSYFVILDYKNGVSYKKKINFSISHSLYYAWLEEMSLDDITGDGVQELLAVNRGSKYNEFVICHADMDTHKIKTIYDTDSAFTDRKEFKGKLKDNYKAELTVPYIGYSKTVSVIKDGGYNKKSLQKKMIDKWCVNYIGMWKKNGKVRKKWAKKHGEVFLYSLRVSSPIYKNGNVLIEFKRDICIGHRAYQIGEMHIYMGYDKDLRKFVVKDAKYSHQEISRKIVKGNFI